MTDISMKQLRYFDALAEHGHFGRAALACAISQPALSIQIKELEILLGAPLVERGPREIRLTSLGIAFALRVQKILYAVDELGDLARASAKELTGTFRFGIIPTVAPYLLPGIVNALSQHYPGLDMRPRESVTPRLVEDLLSGQLDTAIVALPVSEPALAEVPLFKEDFVLVRPESDANLPVPPPERLREMRLLLLEEGHCFRDQAISFCKMAPGASGDLMEGSSLATLVQMVGAGIGVTLIPEMAVRVESRAARISVAQLPEPRPNRQIGIVWRKTNPLARQFTRVAEVLAAAELHRR